MCVGKVEEIVDAWVNWSARHLAYIGILRAGRGWVNYLHLKEVEGGRVVWVPPSEGVGYLQVVQYFGVKISQKGKNFAKFT